MSFLDIHAKKSKKQQEKKHLSQMTSAFCYIFRSLLQQMQVN